MVVRVRLPQLPKLAAVTIEVLQVLNHLEYFMSMNDYFETGRGKGKVSYDVDKVDIDPTAEVELHILEPSALAKANLVDGSMTAARGLYQNESHGREVRHVRLGKKAKKQ